MPLFSYYDRTDTGDARADVLLRVLYAMPDTDVGFAAARDGVRDTMEGKQIRAPIPVGFPISRFELSDTDLDNVPYLSHVTGLGNALRLCCHTIGLSHARYLAFG